jgi:hypothetical protein
VVALLQSSRNDRICDGAGIPGSALLARIAFDRQCRKSPDGNPLYFDIVGLVLAAACAIEKSEFDFRRSRRKSGMDNRRAPMAQQIKSDKNVGCYVVVQAKTLAAKLRPTS